MTEREQDFGLSSPRWRVSRHQDAVTLLMLFAILQLGSPAVYVIGPLGGAGGPASVLGLGLLLWWAVHQLAYGGRNGRLGEPGRWLLTGWLVAVIISYLAASLRPISFEELSSADRGLLSIFSWAGVTFLTMDGVRTRDRLDRLLRTLALMGGLSALLGLIQFQTGLPLTNYLHLPGLSENGALGGVASREGYLRPSGTATHPIEFGVVLAMMLPIALHYAMNDLHRGRLARWWPVATLGLAVSVSVSRSAIICTAVVFVFLLPVWSPAQRRMALVAVAGVLGLVFVAVPGMIGTIFGLFGGLTGGDDTSVASRTDSYALAAQFIERSPFVGRGFGTFLPAYRILDNQYLQTLIELGALGLGALVALQWGSVVIAVRTRRRSTDHTTRQLAQALAASAAAGSIAFAFFDAFSFPQVPGLLFLVLGTIAALRRLSRAAEARPALPAAGSADDEGDLDDDLQDPADDPDDLDDERSDDEELRAGDAGPTLRPAPAPTPGPPAG